MGRDLKKLDISQLGVQMGSSLFKFKMDFL